MEEAGDLPGARQTPSPRKASSRSEASTLTPMDADSGQDAESDPSTGFVDANSRLGRRLSVDFAADYVLEEQVLGYGASSIVRLASCRHTGCKFAVKRISNSVSPKVWAGWANEGKILRNLDHPNIVKVERVCESCDETNMVMERLEGGELFQRIVATGGLEEAAAAKLTVQLLRALGYLHARRIVHRDLKPENVMLATARGDVVKLIDFGFAIQLTPGETLRHQCGTVKYAAPEIFGGSCYTEKVDMWSLGAVVYAMLCARPLYSGASDEVRRKSKVGRIDFCRHFYRLSPCARAFLHSLLNKDGAKRLCVRRCLEHPWLWKHAQAEVLAAQLEVCAEYDKQGSPRCPSPSPQRLKVWSLMSCFTFMWQPLRD